VTLLYSRAVRYRPGLLGQSGTERTASWTAEA